MADRTLTEDNFTEQPFLDFLDGREYGEFLDEIGNKAHSADLVVFSFPIPSIDPLACLEILSDGESSQFYWEKAQDEHALAGGGAAATLTAAGPRRFREINKKMEELKAATKEFHAVSHSRAGLHFLGGFSFFDRMQNGKWKSFAPASFTVPEWLVVKDGKLTLLTLAISLQKGETAENLDRKFKARLKRMEQIFTLDSEYDFQPGQTPGPGLPAMPADSDHKEWIDSVHTARELIRNGEFNKIVLARELKVEMEQSVPPTHMANTLRQQYPACYTFLIRPENSATFVGSSPERLVSFHNNYLLTDALAGSMRRGSSATEDAVMEKKLLSSSKNAGEHHYVVEAIQERLRPWARKIEKADKPTVKKLTNVLHLFTPLVAWPKDGMDRISILEQLHPTPAVGGYPWDKAEPYITKLEHFERGWYAGPVGWLNNNGGGEFAVAIRSALIGEKSASFFAGCGIVSGSDPETEWEETNLKLKPMLSALKYD